MAYQTDISSSNIQLFSPRLVNPLNTAPHRVPCPNASSNTEYPARSLCANCSLCQGAGSGFCRAINAALLRMPGTGTLIAWP